MYRHPSGPTFWSRNQANEAMKKPTAMPLCRQAAALARVDSGHFSTTSETPVPHSAPSPRPVRKRKMASISQDWAKNVRPVKTE
jgi:hypothetical protein